MTRKELFLTAVLGPSSAQALIKSADRAPTLSAVLWPRVVLAWLNTIRGPFEGRLPGTDDTYASFSKSEAGYSGSVTIGEELYRLQDASVFELLAAVSVALDLDQEPVSKSLRDLDLEKLGTSIDLMAKAQMVARELEKGEKVDCHVCGIRIYQKRNAKGGGVVGFHSNKSKTACEGSGKDVVLKKDAKSATATGKPGTGLPHPPEPKKPPAPPTSVGPPPPSHPLPANTNKLVAKPAGQFAKPKAPVQAMKLRATKNEVRLSRSEAHTPCPQCGVQQVSNGAFQGCFCMADLSKSVRLSLVNEQYVLELGEEWDEDALATLFESVGR